MRKLSWIKGSLRTMLAAALMLGASSLSLVNTAARAADAPVNVTFIIYTAPGDPFWNPVIHGAEEAAKDRGVKIDILQIKSDSIGLKALLAGELDSYEGGPVGVLVAGARGADLKILGCHWPTLVHGLFVRYVREFAEDRNQRSQKFYRILNEAPTLLMIAIVILVVVKPF